MSCHHQDDTNNWIVQYFLDLSSGELYGISIVVALFVYGVIGSFTHCIGMCGPIAIGQMNIRLMNLKKDQLTNWNKLNCSLSISYYLGKAISYGVLASIVKLLAISLNNNELFKKISALLIIFAAFICLQIALRNLIKIKKFNFFKQNPKIFLKFEKLLTNLVKRLSLNPFGIHGLLMGMILGLIPCGLVISAIMIVSAYSDSVLISFSSMFFFGLGTFPGLFIVTYLGQNIMLKTKKYMNIIYAIFMLCNFIILLQFGLKLI